MSDVMATLLCCVVLWKKNNELLHHLLAIPFHQHIIALGIVGIVSIVGIVGIVSIVGIVGIVGINSEILSHHNRRTAILKWIACNTCTYHRFYHHQYSAMPSILHSVVIGVVGVAIMVLMIWAASLSDMSSSRSIEQHFVDIPSVASRSAVEKQRWSSTVNMTFTTSKPVPRIRYNALASSFADRVMEIGLPVVITNMPV
jgi:hypothetical protein